MRRRFGSLPLQLFTVLALPLLILLVLVAFGSITLHQVATRDLVAAHDVQAVRGVAGSLSERIDQQEASLTRIAARAARSESPEDELNAWSDTLFEGGVALYDGQGLLLASTGRVESWQTTSPLRPDLLDGVRRATPGSSAILIPLINQGSNATRIAMIVSPAVSPNSRPVTAIGVISLNGLGLPTLLETLQTSESSSVTLATQDGLILYQTDPSLTGTTLPNAPHIAAALRGESGADYRNDANGSELIAAFAPLQETGWVLVQEEHWAEMLSPLMRYSQAAPLVVLPGLIIAIITVWFAIYGIVRPLQRLEASAADLAAGQFTSIEESVGGIEEIRRLQVSLQAMAGQVEKAQEVMRHYIAAITQTQEDERLRLARELHDHTIQALIALDHREQVLRRYLTSDPAGAKVLSELRSMTGEAIDELRRIIRAMRPIYLEDLGLLPALEVLARDIAKGTGPKIHFERQGEPRRLPPEEEMALYRMAQEGITNAYHHSQCRDLWVKVCFEPTAVIVTVQDNGVGFDAPGKVTDLAHNGHFGLIGMYERASLIQAALTVHSAQNKGTTVTIRARTQSTN